MEKDMGLHERIYSVLLISASETFNDAIGDLLSDSAYDPVRVVSNVAAGKRACAERAFDFIIINSPLPDDMGTSFAIDQANSTSAAVLLAVRCELYAEIFDKAVEHGVFVLPKPTSKSTVSTALTFLKSARERLRKTEKKALSIEEKMEEIRIVNKAKWMLIDREHMTEEEAHRYIEKSAMDMCKTKRQIAEEIIQKYKTQ